MVIESYRLDMLSRTLIAVILFMYLSGLVSDEKGTNNPAADSDIYAKTKSVSNKINLLEKLVKNSSMAIRIENSDNQEAKKLLNQARSAWQSATSELNAMNIEQAEEHAKAGLVIMTQASSAVTNTVRLKNEQKTRYQKLRERISSFTEAFQRISLEKRSKATMSLLDRKKVDSLLLRAENMANSGNYHDANSLLVEVADLVEIALVKARDKETLLHELKFESPEEEYSYEKQRNHSYMLLADLIKTKKKVELSRLRHFDEVLAENEMMREKADLLAGNGDIEGAIKILEQGTQKLARTLRASGVVF